tara:strand:- start:216 stop:512 length:297 start_codon:yes stop_codon:yes gene_type:complete
MNINDIKVNPPYDWLNVPTLFLIFTRLSLIKSVLEFFNQSKPNNIYFASDNPRENHLNELKVEESTRHFVLPSFKRKVIYRISKLKFKLNLIYKRNEK